jgi:hypothetical protein
VGEANRSRFPGQWTVQGPGAAGNLRVERFLGTSIVRSHPISRIEYDYSCHE